MCDDEFLYSTLSSWVGIGEESSADIRLTPVAGKAPVVNTPAASQNIQVTPDVEQKEQEEKEVKAAAVVNSECNDVPADVVNAMIGVVALMAIACVCLAAYLMHASKKKENEKVALEANKDFDSVVQN